MKIKETIHFCFILSSKAFALVVVIAYKDELWNKLVVLLIKSYDFEETCNTSY